MHLTDQGCLLRKADSGENHYHLVFFLKENGLKSVLCRRRNKPGSGTAIPDLFESGELTLEQRGPGKPAFLKEFSPLGRFSGIARNYRALTTAAQLCGFYEKNLIHMEHFGSAWALLHSALESLAEKPHPEVTLLKSLYLVARAEGYPVNAHWLGRKGATERQAITALLQNPVGEHDTDPRETSRWIDDLNRFFQAETDLLPANQG